LLSEGSAKADVEKLKFVADKTGKDSHRAKESGLRLDGKPDKRINISFSGFLLQHIVDKHGRNPIQ
jgi:hypothetical protein